MSRDVRIRKAKIAQSGLSVAVLASRDITGVGGCTELHDPLAAAIAGVMLTKQVLDSATIWAGTVQAELTTDHIHQLIHEKSLAVDLAFYESPELHDHLHRARAEGSYRPIAVIENLGSLLQGSITLVAMTTILISFGPILPIGLILSTVPALYVALSSSKNRYEWHYRQTAAERRCCYYDWLLTSSETAAEIRLLRVGNHFRFAYQRLRRHLRSERMELLHKQGLGEVCAGVATLFVSGLMIALMVWGAMRGFISAATWLCPIRLSTRGSP
jgi:ATP-binding cassette, subfamily B, bacterial